ncbi:MAG: HAMP domain-containing sensor histidine kinase, partial [Bdellovibrionia bacterium]
CENKWIALDIMEQSDQVEILVIDSGTGIAPEYRDKIMEPFFTLKEVGKGTGLGLSIAKGLIESHGGTIGLVHNSINTTFAISLPKHPVKEKKRPQE